MRGYFRRAADGSVDAVHLGGRLATRVVEVPAPGTPAEETMVSA
jgi:hypothetical protein